MTLLLLPAVLGGCAPRIAPPPVRVWEPAGVVEVPAPARFEPATRGAAGCIVTVTGVLEAQEYRGGGPTTPALEASLAADPDLAGMFEAEDHADHHIQCHYEVTLAHRPGQRYRWREVHSNTLRDLEVEICNADIPAIAEHIVETTQQCSDLAAGAYWGFVLEAY